MKKIDVLNLQIVPKMKLWFTISIIVILIGVAGMIVNYVRVGSPLILGLDFTGGTILDLKFEKPADVSTARDILKDFGLEDAVIQVAQDGRLIVRTNKALKADEREKIFDSLEEKFGKLDRESIRVETIGPTISDELKKNGAIALGVGLLFIFIYITVRFQFRFAVVTVLALIHDVLVTLGLLALIGQELNSPFVGALLAIIAYSVEDSVVVLDRVRENLRILKGKMSYPEIVNKSICQSITRSFNTSFTTFLAILALILFGGVTIRDFSFTLLFGILSGTYSSIFIAAPLLVVWDRFSKHKIEEKPGKVITPQPATVAVGTGSGEVVQKKETKSTRRKKKNKKKKKKGKRR